MVGTPLALGVEDSALRAIVQGSGSALCLGSAAFVRLLEEHAPLRRILGRYVQVQLALAQTAACAGFQHHRRRLARCAADAARPCPDRFVRRHACLPGSHAGRAA